MKLTTAQKVTLKNDIVAKQATGQPLVGVTDENLIASYYNTLSATSAWRTDTPVSDILDSITWSSYTPNDATDNTATYTNRVLVVQTKQMNLQNMIIGRDRIDTSKANVRSGLRDAVIALPTGVSGAATSAGGASGATVLAACTRLMNRIEALFGTVDATTGSSTAKLLVVEGRVNAQDISDAIAGL